LLAGNGSEYELRAWVVMPNHVHLVVDVWNVPLAWLINRWKGGASRQANQKLNRTGKFWDRDYYDTVIRDSQHLMTAIRYTEQNPNKALLVKDPRDWPWSSARHRDCYNRLHCR